MKTIIRLSLIALMVFSTTLVFSQALVTDGDPGDPHASALLELRSSTKGFMVPHVELGKDGSGVVVAANIEVTPADGLVIYYDGSNVTYPEIPQGLWYWEEDLDVPTYGGKWVIYTKPGSVYANNIDNYGEIFEDDPSWFGDGTTYTITNTAWTGWASASEGQKGSQFTVNLSAAPGDGGAPADNLQISTNAEAAAYTANLSMVIESESSGVPFLAQIFIIRNIGGTEVEVPAAFVQHYFQTGDEYATLATSAIVNLYELDKVEVRMRCGNASETIRVIGANLRLAKISEL